ncbi:hypothetical protein E3J79_01930 [Candidatus Dependentiae bacterium]|nr:MAG: hypothetical protein E3J79_01930 [Candidatus Dependentiae bacterium]
MDKRYLALALLTSLTVNMNYAVSFSDVTKKVLNACTCSKPPLHKLWNYKYLALLTATVATGSFVAYKSEYVRGKVKKFLGLGKKGRAISYRSRSLEGTSEGEETEVGPTPVPKPELEEVVEK